MSDIVILDEKDSVEQKKYAPRENLIEKFNNYLLDSQPVKMKQKLIFYRMLATMVNS
jgi:hypothetical protein